MSVVAVVVLAEREYPFDGKAPRMDLAVMSGVMFAFVLTCFGVMAAELVQWLRFRIALRRSASIAHVGQPQCEGRSPAAIGRLVRKLPK